MRYVRYLASSGRRCARVDGEMLIPLVGDFLDHAEETGERLPLSDAKLLAPLAPPNILAIGLNYRAHALETNASFPDAPILFIKANTTVIGPGQPIVLPQMAPDEVDYEAELAVVIGKAARRVRVEDALDYVFGYTCANDVSARDAQLRHDKQWARGKSFDTFCPLGPWVETGMDPANAAVVSRLNGRVMQESNTGDLIFSVAELVSYLSRCMTLLPGTVIMTGTPGGVGFTRKPPVFLRAGDMVEIEIGGVGVLANQVVAEGPSCGN
ncbi:MAG: fumarylacetoacetate hydrolase family protein [Armatimonadota bacterium]|nr:fumarylacetoacetate hydrolase family protein [Armatimonadota bacterium]